MREKREGKQKASALSDGSSPIEGWSKSEASDAEVSVAVKPETADHAEDSDSHSYVVFHPYVVDYHFCFSSLQDTNADESLNVMLLSCQDPLLAKIYVNLPKIP